MLRPLAIVLGSSIIQFLGILIMGWPLWILFIISLKMEDVNKKEFPGWLIPVLLIICGMLIYNTALYLYLLFERIPASDEGFCEFAGYIILISTVLLLVKLSQPENGVRKNESRKRRSSEISLFILILLILIFGIMMSDNVF